MRRTLLSGLAVVAGYFLLLIGFAAVTETRDIALVEGEGFIAFPSIWGLLIWSFYYLVPVAAAIIFAVWQGRNWRAGALLAAAIFAVHGIASLAAGGLRAAYLADWRQVAEQAEQANLLPGPFSHTFRDENEDGLIDNIVIAGELKVAALPPGRYMVLGQLSQSETGAAMPSLGTQDLTIEAGSSGTEQIRLEIDPERLKDRVAMGPFSVELQISRFREVSSDAKRLLTICAWILWCPTRLNGADPEIYPDLTVIARLQELDRFVLRANQIQRPQFIVRGYSTDYGRDLDGNGLLDELVIAFDVDSLWAGELFFQAQLSALPDAALNYETRVDRGVGVVELVIDGSAIKAAAVDGPYRLESTVIFNNTPYCPGGTCANKNRPLFSVYAPDYTTGPYRAADFE